MGGPDTHVTLPFPGLQAPCFACGVNIHGFNFFFNNAVWSDYNLAISDGQTNKNPLSLVALRKTN